MTDETLDLEADDLPVVVDELTEIEFQDYDIQELSFNAYQVLAQRTAIYPKDKAFEYLALGLTSEAGEVAGKIKKLMRDHPDIMADLANREYKNAIAYEISDVLWYLAMLAHELDLPLLKIAEMNIDKLASRLQRGALQGDGDER